MQEPVDFVINILDRAFQLRNPDAMRRAELFRDRFLSEAAWMARLKTPAAESIASQAIINVKKINSLIQKHRNRKLNGNSGPTPETLCQSSRLDPLEKLKLSGDLEDHHIATGRRIAQVYEAITSSVHARGSKLISAGRASMTWRDDVNTWASDAYTNEFKPWCKELRRKKISVPLVIDIIVFAVSIREARKKHRMGKPRIVRDLLSALETYRA